MDAINFEAEQQAVATILRGKQYAWHLLSTLNQTHFGDEAAQEVFVRVGAFVQRNPDKGIPPLDSWKTSHLLSKDARAFIENLQFPPITQKDGLEFLITTLNQHKRIRLLYTKSRELLDMAKDAAPDTLTQIESELEQLTLQFKGVQQNDAIVTFGAGDEDGRADEIINRIVLGDDKQFIKTGFEIFDVRNFGMKKSNAVLIAGPTGAGKSAMANQLLVNMYSKFHHKVVYISFEMDEVECASRMLSAWSGIEFAKILDQNKDPATAELIQTNMKKFRDIGKQNDAWFKLWSPTEGLTPSSLVSYCKPLGADVIVVDYVGLLAKDNPKRDLWENLGDAMGMFKAAAASMNVVMIVLAQFDQKEMQVRYSRQLQEHANIMWSWLYGQEEQETGRVVIRQTHPFGKNRNAQPFDFIVRYDMSRMSITAEGPADDSDRIEIGAGNQPLKSSKPDKLPRIKVNTKMKIYEED